MKTKKLLSVLMAVIMLFGCMTVSASAIDWPKDLEAGAVTVRGLSTVTSVEIPVAAEYTAVAADATFKVYYSEEKAEDAFDYLGLEEVGTVGSGDAYIADGVLHINLAGLKLSTEGYYYISVGSGALVYDCYYNMAATTEGVQYQFASLDLFGKISAVFDYVLSIISNMISNGKSF